jgi:hypothetical protein
MIKRATWFVGGVAAGAAGASYAKRKVTRTVKRTAATLAPANLARAAADRVRDQGRHIADAAREGRAAMRSREDELRARRDARVEPLDDHLAPGDQLLVDGRPVESGRVIVLRHRTEPDGLEHERAARRASRRKR